MIELDKSVVLITGGNRGIGKATAELFSEKGATVLFTSRHKDTFPQLEKEFIKRGASKSKGYLFDIRMQSESVHLIQQIKRDFETIDILINNAGVGFFNNIAELTPREWEDVINTNLTGVFYLTHEVLPLMTNQKKGHIVNVGSLASKNTFVGGGAYCASKFGLLGFSECLMLEVRDYNIKVSTIMPGSVNTPFMTQTEDSDDETWKLTAKDVADTIYDVVNTRSGHLMSRVELRPLMPSKKK